MAKKVTIEEALDYCLANPDNLPVSDLLAIFPEHRQQIEPLLTLALGIQSAPEYVVDPARKAAIKQRVLAQAASRYAPGRGPRPAIAVRPVGGMPAARRLLRPMWAIAAAAAALVFFFWWSASSALADSPLYGVKLAGENVLLSLSSNPADKAMGDLSLANSRLSEMKTMSDTGKLARAGQVFDNFQEHLNSGIKDFGSVTGDQHTQVAKALYLTSQHAAVTVGPLANDPNLPASVQDKITSTLSATTTAQSVALQALSADGVPLNTLPTPVQSPVALATSTNTGPAPATNTPVRPAAATRTSTPVVSSALPTRALPAGSPTSVPLATVGGAIASTPTPTRASGEIARVSRTPVPVVPPTRTATRTTSPTRTPSTTATPFVPPTYTPTMPAIYSATPVPPTATVQSPDFTFTPEPTTEPTFTPGRPVATFTYTPTYTATFTPTHTPTYTPVPPVTATSTPVVPTPGECSLSVSDVSADCVSSTCVAWSGTVENSTNAPVAVAWTAELQIKDETGGFRTVATQQGNSVMTAGANNLDGTICAQMPASARFMKVVFSVTGNGGQCSVQGTSGSVDACVAPDTTPSAEPTRTPRPTNEPRVTNTPRPRPTHGRDPNP